jgi:hypothetical protein
MYVINLHDLSVHESERLIQEVWIVIEKHHIGSPRLTSRRQADQVEIALTFEAEADRTIVARELRAHGTARVLMMPEVAAAR